MPAKLFSSDSKGPKAQLRITSSDPKVKNVLDDFGVAIDSRKSPGSRLYSQMQIFPGVFNKNVGDEAKLFDRLMTQIICDGHNSMEPYAMDENQKYVSETTPYGGNLARLSCRAGHYMTPCGVQPPVTPEYTDKLLPDPEQDRLLAFLTKATCQVLDPVNIDLNNISTSGYPDWVRDVKDKMPFIEHILSNFERIDKLVKNKDMESLLSEFHIMMAYHQTYRVQADTSKIAVHRDTFTRLESKARKVFNFDGKMVTADKTIPGSILEAERVRLAAAAAGWMNLLVRFMERSISGYQDRFPVLWKHREGSFNARKLEGVAKVVSSDDSNFDQSVPYAALKIICANMGLKSHWADFLLMSFNASFTIFGDSPLTGGFATMRGNPLDAKLLLSTPQVEGLPSGHGFVSYVGKIFGFHQTLIALRQAGCISGDLIMHAEACMKGIHPDLVILNLGDDNLIGFFDERKGDKFEQYLIDKAGSDPALSVKKGLELPTLFLGTYFYPDPKQERKWKTMPRIESSLVNFLVPERGIGGKFRPHWSIGLAQEHQVYGDNSMLQIVQGIRERAFRDVYGLNFDRIVKAHFAQSLRTLELEQASFGANLTEDELLFIENPDRRHYGRVNMDNVRESIQNRFLQNLEGHTWQHVLDFLFEDSIDNVLHSESEIISFFNHQ